MPRLRSLTKRALAYVLYYSGALWLYAAVRLRGRAVVLMYHRVLPVDADTFSHRGIIVSPDTFDWQMEFLRRHFRPLSPEQFCGAITGRRFPRRACLVTFDDGWRDNVDHALPILERHRMPAVLFVTTDYVGTNRVFWRERLSRLLYLASRSEYSFRDVLVDLGLAHTANLSDNEARAAIGSAVAAMKGQDPSVVGSLLARLEDKLGGLSDSRPNGDDALMTWTELRTIERRGLVSVGSHAHTHTPLPRLGYDGTLMEFQQSMDALTKQRLRPVQICAYPNGEIDDAVADAARDAGFAVGLTTEHRLASPDDDHLRLGRINIHESATASSPEFLWRLLQLP